MNKRGLSDIIATVMIILLVLAAVGIIAYFVFPLIEGGLGQGSLQTQCLQTTVKPTSCFINTTTNVSNVNVQLTDEGASQVNVLLQDGAGSTKLGTAAAVPTIYSTTTITITNTDTLDETTTKAKAIAIVSNEQGETLLCTPSSVEFTCTYSA